MGSMQRMQSISISTPKLPKRCKAEMRGAWARVYPPANENGNRDARNAAQLHGLFIFRAAGGIDGSGKSGQMRQRVAFAQEHNLKIKKGPDVGLRDVS